MKTIFVMVKCELGKAYEVADAAVGEIEQVSEVYSTSGQFDLLMKCYLPDSTDIGHFVTERLQSPARRQGHVHDHRLQGVFTRYSDVNPVQRRITAAGTGRSSGLSFRVSRACQELAAAFVPVEISRHQPVQPLRFLDFRRRYRPCQGFAEIFRRLKCQLDRDPRARSERAVDEIDRDGLLEQRMMRVVVRHDRVR